MKPDRVIDARTNDRWRIAIHHWEPRGTGRAEPVLLCHGLASCAATWELEPGRGFAPWLAARGHPVFALDLRGAGSSDKPRLGGKREYVWGVHEYLTQDIPAAIDRVLRETGHQSLHWVGHSMGGVLLLAFASRDLGARLKTATTVASTLDYKVGGSDFGQLHSLAGFLRLIRAIPVGTAARAYARLGRDTYFDDFMFAPENLTRAEKREIWRRCFTWVPGLVLRELASTFEAESFRGRDGLHWRHGLPRIATPLLLLAGTRDRQCSVPAARATFEAAGSARKRFLSFDGLGHFDLLVGARAEREVWPEIARWIEEDR